MKRLAVVAVVVAVVVVARHPLERLFTRTTGTWVGRST
jgi:hypothetical protein